MRALAVLWVFAPVLTAQTTWIVDASGLGTFLDIPPAIAAASPGDRVVVIGPATYSAFVLDRGIDVETTTHAAVPTIEVVGVPAGERARVAGFDVAIQSGVLAVSVRSCVGPVLLVDITETGWPSQVQYGMPGLEIRDSRRVFVERGSFRGQPGSSAGGEGLVMAGSSAFLVDSTFVGSVHASLYPSTGNRGLAGIELGNSEAFLCGVTARGGPGGQGNIVGGNGGAGLDAVSGSHAVAVGSCTFEGLPGGWGGMFYGQDGAAVNGAVDYTYDCTLIGGAPSTVIPNRPVLDMTPSLPVGGTLAIGVHGEPGQFVALAIDFVHGFAAYPQYGGAIALTASHVVVAFVSLDAGGAGGWSATVPAYPWLQGIDVYAQGVADVTGSPALLAPTHTRLR